MQQNNKKNQNHAIKKNTKSIPCLKLKIKNQFVKLEIKMSITCISKK